jgi:hypothetical protein
MNVCYYRTQKVINFYAHCQDNSGHTNEEFADYVQKRPPNMDFYRVRGMVANGASAFQTALDAMEFVGEYTCRPLDYAIELESGEVVPLRDRNHAYDVGEV